MKISSDQATLNSILHQSAFCCLRHRFGRRDLAYFWTSRNSPYLYILKESGFFQVFQCSIGKGENVKCTHRPKLKVLVNDIGDFFP
jgi:hypothetical protein